jgi:hypothetical protein
MRGSGFWGAILLLAAPAAARTSTTKALPDTDAVLIRALSAPATGFTAVGRIQSFGPGRKARGLGMTMSVLPDGRVRRELRARARGPAELIFVDDGGERKLYWPKQGTVWAGAVTRETPETRASRLKALYAVSLSTGGRVAKRPTWRLNFIAPDGRLRRSLWVDRDGGMPLKCEEYRLDGALARRERFTRLVPGAPEPGLFRLEAPPGTALAPLTAPRGAGDPVARFPRWIPRGFLALSLRGGRAGSERTLTIGYGDGAAAFAVMEAPRGADLGFDEKAGRAVRLQDGSAAYLLSQNGELSLVRRTRERAYVVSGGIMEDEMVRVAESLEDPGP